MPRPRKMLPMQECIIQDEHKRGAAIADIAHKYGVSASTVQRIVKNDKGPKKPAVKPVGPKNFKTLLRRDKTHPKDTERTALFWILACNADLFTKAAHIYDFEDHSILPDVLESDVDFCSSSRALVRLGFNLFNGFPTDCLNTFASLDDENYALAMEAINMRFNR